MADARVAYLRTLVLAVCSPAADTAPIAVLAAVVGALVAWAMPDPGKQPAETPPL